MAGTRRLSRRAPSTYQPACKPGSVGRGLHKTRVNALLLAARDGHSSGTPVARRLQQPTRTAGSGHRSRDCSRAAPIRSCSRWGLPCRFRCRKRGALLPHRFTLAVTLAGSGGLLSVALSLELLPPDVIRHRMSMEPGLSSRGDLSALPQAAVRPTDRTGVGWRGARVKGARRQAPGPRIVITAPIIVGCAAEAVTGTATFAGRRTGELVQAFNCKSKTTRAKLSPWATIHLEALG